MNPQETFCPNAHCPSRGQVGAGNISVHSWPRQRYRCRTCQKTFAATIGTAFYRLRHDSERVSQVVTLLAYGCPPAAVVAAFGHASVTALDARTVSNWQKRAGAHCERVHEALVLGQCRNLVQVQADEIRVKMQRRLVVCRHLRCP